MAGQINKTCSGIVLILNSDSICMYSESETFRLLSRDKMDSKGLTFVQ